MRVLIAQGADFRNVVTEGLRSTMGESPAEILLNMVGTSAFVNPAIFAAEVHKLFGKGADSIYESVQKYAAESLEHPDATNQPVYDQLVEEIQQKEGPASAAPRRSRFKRFLHDFRNEDGGADDGEDTR
jgi:hypothetical protein